MRTHIAGKLLPLTALALLGPWAACGEDDSAEACEALVAAVIAAFLLISERF